MKIQFYLKSESQLINQTEKKVTIYADFSYDGKRLQISTNLSVPLKDWSKSKKYVKPSCQNYYYYHNYLETFKSRIGDFYYKYKSEKSTYPELSLFRKHIKDLYTKNDESKTDIEVAIENFIQLEKPKLHERTMKNYSKFFKQLKEFSILKNIRLEFRLIDFSFLEEYKVFLNSIQTLGRDGLSNATINKRITNLKHFMNWSRQMKFHSNLEYQDFKTIKEERTRKISLTFDELSLLENINLPNNKLKKARDLFLFQTYVGQRISDIKNFNKNDIKVDRWEFTAMKTKKLTTIPLNNKWGEKALCILKEYDYSLPKLSEQKLNDYIKDVAKLAGINKMERYTRTSLQKTKEIEKPRYERISSHTARRTFITLLLNKGIAPNTLMKLTNHSDLGTLQKYDCSTYNDVENAMKKIDF